MSANPSRPNRATPRPAADRRQRPAPVEAVRRGVCAVRVGGPLGIGLALCLAACGGGDDQRPVGVGSAVGSASVSGRLDNELGAAYAERAVVTDAIPTGSDLSALTGFATTLLRTEPARLGVVATSTDPAQVLGAGRVIDNPYQPDNRDAASPFPLNRLAGLGDAPFPTGKWYKGFLYQTPASLTSNFADAPASDPAAPRNGKNDASQESVFAFPNRLNLDDRIPMVSAAFPRPRYISASTDPNDGTYQFTNRYVTDTVLYTIDASPLADLQFAASTSTAPDLTRRIVAQDELTVTTRWQSADAARQMELTAAVGSPFVTVRWQGLPAVIGVGQGTRIQYPKSPGTNLPTGGAPDYTQWESVSGIVAVAAGTGDLSAVPSQRFVEMTAPAAITPDLTGSAFRFVYQVPDPSRSATPRTNNGVTPPVGLINRVMNVYTSAPVTLQWNAAARTYVSAQPFTGVMRAAFVGEAVIGDVPPENLRFDAVEKLLFTYRGEYPTAGEVIAKYDGAATATLHFVWTTKNLDPTVKPDSTNLLMMAFDATQTPSLQGARQVALGYASNFGRMSGIVGGQWTQQLAVPEILSDLPAAQSARLWWGNGSIKDADKPRLRAQLQAEATDTQAFITHCNYESYTCGKYIAGLGRLALIADQLGETQLRSDLVAFMKQNLNPWFDGSDPTDPDIKGKTDPANPIFDYFVYDRTNKGLVTFRPYNRRDYKDDFYNLTYTDHMFHYGYFVYAAAVIAKLDADPARAWFTKYRPYVDLLVRDIANPSADDAHFPVMRTYDWFRMQNLASSGPTPNGSNTESSSESINSDYALGLWGAVTDNGPLRGLAAVMTAGEIRTAQAIYQVTPATSVFRGNGVQSAVAPITVTVNDHGVAKQVTLDPNAVPTRGIVWSQITQQSVFFGPRQQYIVGIQVLPVTPISEYVLSKDWVKAHAAELQALEDATTANYTEAILKVPGPDAECAIFAVRTGPTANPPNTLNYGGGCAAAARTENAWRQILVSLNGVGDPTGSYNRFASILDKSVTESANYTNVLSNPSVNPGSSTDAKGSLPDLIRQTSTPSTNSNVLWWLSTRKPS